MWGIKKFCYFELLPPEVGRLQIIFRLEKFESVNSYEIYDYKSQNLPSEKVSY